MFTLIFVSCIKNSYGMFQIIYGEDDIVIDMGGVAGCADVIAGCPAYPNRTFCVFHHLEGLRRRVNNIEIFLQYFPTEGVGSLEKGDVDSKGVIDGEVFDERGLDTLDILVAQVLTAAFLQRQLAREKGEAGADDQSSQDDNQGYATTFFHFPSI